MGRKKASIGPVEESSEMDMSPMIDMVFLLIIFFVVNAAAITVKTDPTVAMPLATASSEIKSANGYITVSVWGDKRPEDVPENIFIGTESGEPLATDEDLTKYIEETVKDIKESPRFKNGELKLDDLRLYIRGDQKAMFKYSRKIIKIAGANDVSNVVFGVKVPAPKDNYQ